MAVKRGEIYFVNLNPVKGKEQAGNRPVLVLSIEQAGLKLCALCGFAVNSS